MWKYGKMKMLWSESLRKASNGFFLVSNLRNGHGGLCKALTREERRKWKAETRERYNIELIELRFEREQECKGTALEKLRVIFYGISYARNRVIICNVLLSICNCDKPDYCGKHGAVLLASDRNGPFKRFIRYTEADMYQYHTITM